MIKRVLSVIGVIWLAATLAFFALRLLPGDAITSQLVESGASRAQVETRRAALGINEPVFTQYTRWLGGVLTGDLGVSLQDGQPVNEIIVRQLPATVSLAFAALLVAILGGLVLGSAAGLGSSMAQFTLNIALSAPLYWTGTLAIWVFAVLLDWLPSSGETGWASLILPSAVLGFHTAGAIGRVIAAGVADTAESDFVITARSKGLPENLILWRHILRVSLPPAVRVIALQAGFLLGGVVITETLFIRPGIGRVLLDAVMRQDYPLVQGIVVWTATVYIVVNATADGITRQLDPRVSS